MDNIKMKNPLMLIVEDKLAYQEVYTDLFEEEYNLVIKQNKDDAFQFLRVQEPAIALLDMKLVENDRNNTDGLDIAEFINNLGYKTVIILKSGFLEESKDIEERIKSINFFEVLKKNSDQELDLLINTISRASESIKKTK